MREMLWCSGVRTKKRVHTENTEVAQRSRRREERRFNAEFAESAEDAEKRREEEEKRARFIVPLRVCRLGAQWDGAATGWAKVMKWPPGSWTANSFMP